MRTTIAAIWAPSAIAVSQCLGCASDRVALAPPPPPPPPLPVLTAQSPAAPTATESSAATTLQSTHSEGQVLVEAGHADHRDAPSPLKREGVDGPLRYEVAVLNAGVQPDVYTLALFRDMGQGLLGQKSGSAVKVEFPDGSCGPGWVDARGDLQAVIYMRRANANPGASPLDDPCIPARYTPAADHRVFEQRNGAWMELKPALHLETKKATGADKKTVDATIAVLDARAVGADARSLAGYLGLALGRGYRGRVRVQLSPRASAVGLLGDGGKLSIESTDAWSPELQGAEGTAAASTQPKDRPPECAKSVCLEVDDGVMQKVHALGDDIVFFTSRKRPLHSLNEIKAGAELGMWGMDLFTGSQELLRAAQVQIGIGGMAIVGDAYFASLFTKEHPDMRLFITHSYDDHREAAITKQGGGVRLYFVPKRP